MGDVAKTSPDPAGNGQGVCHFAGRTLDLNDHVLLAADGTPVDLTRGELALLRALARRPGHALTRDQLLDAISGRGGFAFDRSVDMMVARLRRKLGDNGRSPRLIVTVPGVGYRLAVQVAPGPASGGLAGPAEAMSAGALSPMRPWLRWRLVAAVMFVGVLAGLVGTYGAGGSRTPTEPVTTVILPFVNVGGDIEQAYFAEGVAAHLAIQLGSFPVMRVVAPTATAAVGRGPVEAARAVGADYAVQGEVLRGPGRIRITAQLYDARTGIAAWGDRFDVAGADPIALQEEIADRIYRSIAGFRGIVHQEAVREAWRKATPDLDEYDYVLRGHHFYLRFTKEDVLTARGIWQAGLDRYPASALLRGKLAWTHIWMVMNSQTDDRSADIETAWQLARAAERIEPKSPMTEYLLHYAMAFLYQLRDDGFGRSLGEADAAYRFAPYDTMLRTDLAFLLANAGRLEEAVAMAQWAVEHEASPPDFYWNNLGWALYLGGRYDEAIAATRRAGASAFAPQIAASLVALKREGEAHDAMVGWLAANPRDSVAVEAQWPLIEPYEAEWLKALRTAGLPEK